MFASSCKHSLNVRLQNPKCGLFDESVQLIKAYAGIDCCMLSVPTGSPQNFTAIGHSSTSIRLQWDAPPRKHRNGEIVLYEVLYHQQRPSTVDWTTNTTEQSVMVEGLETSTDYNFMIRAYTAVGPGPWSNRLPFRTFPHREHHSHPCLLADPVC